MRDNRRLRLLKDKIMPLAKLKKVIAALKAKGEKIVFTNGCFDLLHYGHAKYLQDAKNEGDILVVAVNSDASLKRIKGDKRPITGEKDRLRLIAALESVDYVTLFNDDTPIKVIKALRPDILVKGADWNKQNIVGADFLLGTGGKVKTIKLLKGRSTTGLIKKIAESY